MASNVRFVKIRSSEIYTMIHFESLYIHKPPILCKTRVYTSYKEDNNMLRCCYSFVDSRVDSPAGPRIFPMSSSLIKKIK